MRTAETDAIIALQPETEVEQSLLAQLFQRLNESVDAPAHPEKVGTIACHYSLDIPSYRGLDEQLWDDAECFVNEHGRLDPEPGSRALVVVHTPERLESLPEEPTDETADEPEPVFGPGDEPADEPAGPPFDPAELTVPELRDALDDGDYTGAELRDLYEAEQAGEARTTALDAIEEAGGNDIYLEDDVEDEATA